MARIFSGIQPSGDLHIGNLLGALKNWIINQDEHDAVYCVVDLHALTIPSKPEDLRANTLSIIQLLLAAGIDPEKCILFVQSHVNEHSQLGWLLECTVSFGELKRMTQFKDKSDRADFISAGLFTYPALQAADILLYDTEIVPVGEDQRQHIELTRDIAERFNSRYGQTFILPEHHISKTGSKIMDLQEPTKKMSKSDEDSGGTLLVLDDPKTIEKKIQRAVTDSESEVRYDPEKKPGVSNLLEIIGGFSDQNPKELEGKYKSYKDLKQGCAEVAVAELSKIQQRYRKISADPALALNILSAGAEAAQVRAAQVLARAKENIGLAV